MNKEYGVTEEQLTSDMPVSAPLTVKAKVSPDTGSFSGRDLSGITLEKLRQIDEDQILFDCASDAIGDVFSIRFKQYMDEKSKSQPDQSVLDKLDSELIKLHNERRFLSKKTREEIKFINNYYSKIVRDDFNLKRNLND